MHMMHAAPSLLTGRFLKNVIRKGVCKAHGAEHLRHIIEIGEDASTAQRSRRLSATPSLLLYRVAIKMSTRRQGGGDAGVHDKYVEEPTTKVTT
jgi:hypothetical protein